ncbi:MAG: hypothetical protein KZQ94_16045 [Candidatus Thiodiazotropha sp. (ex Troendleina suluensis)]|nr:hypothetical protein [Candidatus Thiodiazotropha sp. (ex Troendleina suluensis)]
MAVKYDLMVANGTYQKDGQQKTAWLKIGRVMSKQSGGFVIKIDCIPTSSTNRDGNQVAWDGWVQMFESRQQGAQSQPAAAPTSVPDSDFDDDIAF